MEKLRKLGEEKWKVSQFNKTFVLVFLFYTQPGHQASDICVLDITSLLLDSSLHQEARLCGEPGGFRWSGGSQHHGHLREVLLCLLLVQPAPGDIEPAGAGQVGEEIPLLGQFVFLLGVVGDHSLLHRDLIPPEPVLVTRGEAEKESGGRECAVSPTWSPRSGWGGSGWRSRWWRIDRRWTFPWRLLGSCYIPPWSVSSAPTRMSRKMTRIPSPVPRSRWRRWGWCREVSPLSRSRGGGRAPCRPGGECRRDSGAPRSVWPSWIFSWFSWFSTDGWSSQPCQWSGGPPGPPGLLTGRKGQ